MLSVGSHRLAILSLVVDRHHIISPNENVYMPVSGVYVHNPLVIHNIMFHDQHTFSLFANAR